MKRALILFFVAAFLISVSGCRTKSEYDKLAEEKRVVDKKYEQLSLKEASLREENSARQKEIKSLDAELKKAKAKIGDLEKKLTVSKAKTRDLEKKIAELKNLNQTNERGI